MEQFVFPKKIVDFKNVKNAGTLLKNKFFKKTIMQVGYYEDDCMIVGNDGGYVVLDFGKEMSGGIIISTSVVWNQIRSAKIRVCFGESLMEVYSSIGEKNSSNHHSTRDFEYILADESTISIGQTGYRFVKIDFYAGANQVDIKSIIGTNTILNKKAKYRYNGKDLLVKKIFNCAKRTVDLCSSSGVVWDGVKRDRLVWVGDLYPEVLSLTAMYGRVEEIENSLEFERQRKKFEEVWFCSLNTYNAWWAICYCEYYLQVGKAAEQFMRKNLDYLYEQIELIGRYIKDDGKMVFPEKTNFFVDWPCKDCVEDVETGARFIFMLMMKKAKELFETLGISTLEVESLYQKLQKGNLNVLRKKQVIGLKFLATGSISDEEYEKLIKNGAEGFSTFMSYPILTAIASKNKNIAVELMKQYYGAMIDKGATTFWEDFDIISVVDSGRIDKFPKKGQKDIHGDYGKFCYEGFRCSLCHAWSCGVNAFIKENCEE